MNEIVSAEARRPIVVPKGFELLDVTAVKHYTERLFGFTTERPPSLRFRSGEFVMLGLMVEGKRLLRAYSIASPNWADRLEFFSIKVPHGPLTSRLQRVVPGDRILLRPKPVGTLVLDSLVAGRRLLLLSTGTGIAPFTSIIRDPETYEKFEQIHLFHTARLADELTYGRDVMRSIFDNELLAELCEGKLFHHASTTCEPSPLMGRIGTMIDDGRFADLSGGPLDPTADRVMICGSMEVLRTLKAICEAHGFVEGSNASPGQFVIEKAFADA